MLIDQTNTKVKEQKYL